MNEVALAIMIASISSTGLWTVVNTLITARMERKKAEQKNPMQDMVLGTGYAILIYICNQYIERGWISTAELMEINKYLLKPYLELGGNGNAEMLFNEVKNLPRVAPEVKEGSHERFE